MADNAMDPVVEVARIIRPYLGELVGSDAEKIDEQLAELITEAVGGQDRTTEILAVLAERPAVRDWTARVLESSPPLPLDLVDAQERGFSGLPGLGEPIAAERFICPRSDYVWYRRAVGQPIPTCPTHAVKLVPEPAPGP